MCHSALYLIRDLIVPISTHQLSDVTADNGAIVIEHFKQILQNNALTVLDVLTTVMGGITTFTFPLTILRSILDNIHILFLSGYSNDDKLADY